MRAVVQRVSSASVLVDGAVSGEIQAGLLVLLGVGHGDTSAQARWMAEKCANLRIFQDDEGKMNLSVLEVGGGVLAVSQFTLLADARKGRRPSFVDAADPEKAVQLYEEFVQYLKQEGCNVQCGVFGAKMEVRLVNDGPVTIVIDTP